MDTAVSSSVVCNMKCAGIPCKYVFQSSSVVTGGKGHTLSWRSFRKHPSSFESPLMKNFTSSVKTHRSQICSLKFGRADPPLLYDCQDKRSSLRNYLSSSNTLFNSDWKSDRRGRTFSPRRSCCIQSSLRAADQVEVLVNQESFNKQLLTRINILKEPYKRPLLLSNCHVETIFAAYFRTLPTIQYKRECLKMVDGGTVALDWPVGGEDAGLWSSDLPEDAPVLVLLPGLTGGSGDTYVRHMLVRARKAGWRPVVFNSRGCGDSPVTSPQFYSASFTEDLRQVVKYVANYCSNSRIYAAGWSLGANILVRYLGQEGENCVLSGAVSLCNPFDLVLADINFHQGFNNIYDKSLASALQKIFKKHAKLFEGIGGEYNIEKAANPKTVRDFDEGITRVSFGFKTVDEYYDFSSSSRSIKDVRIPLLCVQAEDDPIAPAAGIPRADIEANKNCALVVTPGGGHLGWIAGGEAPLGAPWTDPLVMDYLVLLNSQVSSGKGPDTRKRQESDARLVSVDMVGGSMGVPEPEEAVIR